MKLLILGGTVFLGRHLTEAALARGHEVTLLHRGQRGSELFPNVERILGDRDPAKGDGLAQLGGRTWDAVIDTSGYVPRIVGAAAQALAKHAKHYLFISTISVYRDLAMRGIDEAYPLGILEDPTIETISGESYGPLKALCEAAVREHFGPQHTIVRPGLIVGPHDPTDRFTYWPVRAARGGRMIAPGAADAAVQIIDARDLAVWCLHLLEQQQTGIFNAVGPATTLTMQQLLKTCQAVAQTPSELVWLSDQQLLSAEVGPWMELPLWIPDGPNEHGFAWVSHQRALAAGLTFRPLEATIADTLAWAQQRPADYQWRAGLSAEREASVLAQYTSE